MDFTKGINTCKFLFLPYSYSDIFISLDYIDSNDKQFEQYYQAYNLQSVYPPEVISSGLYNITPPDFATFNQQNFPEESINTFDYRQYNQQSNAFTQFIDQTSDHIHTSTPISNETNFSSKINSNSVTIARALNLINNDDPKPINFIRGGLKPAGELKIIDSNNDIVVEENEVVLHCNC